MMTNSFRLETFNADVVYEQMAYQCMTDGNIYVVAGPESPRLGEVQRVVSNVKSTMEGASNIYNYAVESIDISAFSHNGALNDAVSIGYNLIIPLAMHNHYDKPYLILRSNNAMLDIHIPQMLMQAENLTMEGFHEYVNNLAIQAPEACGEILESIFPNAEETLSWSDKLFKASTHFISSLLQPDFYSAAYTPTLPKIHNLDVSELDHKRTKEIIKRFTANWEFVAANCNNKHMSNDAIEKFAVAKKEIDYVIKLLTTEAYVAFTEYRSSKGIDYAYRKCVDRSNIANHSDIEVSINRVRRKQGLNVPANKRKTDGRYRIFLKSGDKKVQVRFPERTSCILYMLYLIDRKRRDRRSNFIDIRKMRQQYIDIYTAVYKHDHEDKYNSVDSEANAKYSQITDGKRLKDAFNDIRNALGEAVFKFKEPSFPFYIPNTSTHIAILASKINVSELVDNEDITHWAEWNLETI